MSEVVGGFGDGSDCVGFFKLFIISFAFSGLSFISCLIFFNLFTKSVQGFLLMQTSLVSKSVIVM